MLLREPAPRIGIKQQVFSEQGLRLGHEKLEMQGRETQAQGYMCRQRRIFIALPV